MICTTYYGPAGKGRASLGGQCMEGGQCHGPKARQMKQGSCVSGGTRETPKLARCEPGRTTHAYLTRLFRQTRLKQPKADRSILTYGTSVPPRCHPAETYTGNPTWTLCRRNAKRSANLTGRWFHSFFLTQPVIALPTIYFFILHMSCLDNRPVDLSCI